VLGDLDRLTVLLACIRRYADPFGSIWGFTSLAA
jgi:hypothetical protein